MLVPKAKMILGASKLFSRQYNCKEGFMLKSKGSSTSKSVW